VQQSCTALETQQCYSHYQEPAAAPDPATLLPACTLAVADIKQSPTAATAHSMPAESWPPWQATLSSGHIAAQCDSVAPARLHSAAQCSTVCCITASHQLEETQQQAPTKTELHHTPPQPTQEPSGPKNQDQTSSAGLNVRFTQQITHLELQPVVAALSIGCHRVLPHPPGCVLSMT
jgi:hypothetical protein